MSIENHPNIHAVGLTLDVMESFMSRLRGRAGETNDNRIASLGLIKDEVVDFVVKVSTKLDEMFPKEISCDQTLQH